LAEVTAVTEATYVTDVTAIAFGCYVDGGSDEAARRLLAVRGLKPLL
jgi:hypothetical protein